MRRSAVVALLLTSAAIAACTSSPGPSRDPGKVVLPQKKISVAGHLYATKGRVLYVFAGTRLTPVLKGRQVQDPAVTPDGRHLAFSQLQGQSSVIVLADANGENPRPVTEASAAEGSLWAFKSALSTDGGRLLYLSDRGKQRSSPRNLQPNDLGVWSYDVSSGRSQRLVSPMPYTGGDSDPTFYPGATDRLLFTTYLYGGHPLLPVARLTWMSVARGERIYLSPDGARTFQPAISPDGRFVAFIRANGTSDDLYVMPLAASYASEPKPYPTDGAVLLQAGMVSQPVWSPDGASIAFLMLAKGSFDLFVLPVSTTGAVRATGAAQEITHGSFLDADSRLAWGA